MGRDSSLICQLVLRYADVGTLVQCCQLNKQIHAQLTTSETALAGALWRRAYARSFPSCKEKSRYRRRRGAAEWRRLAMVRRSLMVALRSAHGRSSSSSSSWRHQASQIMLDDSVYDLAAIERVRELCELAELRIKVTDNVDLLCSKLRRLGIVACMVGCHFDDRGDGGLSGRCSVSLYSTVALFLPQSASPLLFTYDFGVSGYNDDPELWDESALYCGVDPTRYRPGWGDYVTSWMNHLLESQESSSFIERFTPSKHHADDFVEPQAKRRKNVSFEYLKILEVGGDFEPHVKKNRHALLRRISPKLHRKVKKVTGMSLGEVILHLLEGVRGEELSWFTSEAASQFAVDKLEAT